ncbi:MAG TPA: alpha/beta hydrolase-fold protein [Gaiellaceae bacterium]|nr:alpha/beta hydrolase-fold protein [Gaiellaceae bacterium]
MGADSPIDEVPYIRQPLVFPARYAHGPDSSPRPDTPSGAIREYEWADSRVFPGTTRRYWVYVPAQYTEKTPAPLMVFQDAAWYLNLDFEVRAPVVLDNLIHNGEMPATVVVFVEPSENRNAEYDAFSDAYARFLIDEIIPAVRAEYAITDDPDQWAVAGGSSGGNCAFTAAWFRPDRFRRVYCALGSFVQMPGGNPYPELIRATPTKPLRIWLQAATRDLHWNEPEHNWLSANLQVAAALAERGYDFRLVVGDGGHDGNHGGVLLPDALRWLWAE